MRILIAEDDSISRMLLQRTIEKLGHECVAATDGGQAWTWFQEGDYDIVISDWMMPEMDGIQFCQRVRAYENSHYTYFVILTALDSKQSFVTGMEAGADDYLTKPLDREALEARLIAAQRLTALHQELSRKNQELEQLNQKLFDEGRVDALTRVGNRLRMTEDLAAMHDRVARYGHRFCVALCDVDFFKKFNDTCGHQAGDETLRAVAQTFSEQRRVGDAVYRYGGEEFLLLFPEQTLDTAYIAAERMRKAIEDKAMPHPGKDPVGVVTVSGGLASVAQDDQKAIAELLEQADAALYRAKQTGRNRVIRHGQEA